MFKFSDNIRLFIRCLPPSDNRKESSEYKSVLAQALNCNRSLVTKEVRSLNESTESRYAKTPFEFYKQDGSEYNTLLFDAGLEYDNVFARFILYLIHSERYGIANAKVALDAPNGAEGYSVMVDFIKLMAKRHKATIIDTAISYYKALGLYDEDVKDLIEDMAFAMGAEDGSLEYGNTFHVNVSKEWIDNFSIKYGYLREVVIDARAHIISHHESFEAAGLKFVDSPGVTCLSDDENDTDADTADMS